MLGKYRRQIGTSTLKDQYFGDVNDFRKYGLLRALAVYEGFRPGGGTSLQSILARAVNSDSPISTNERNRQRRQTLRVCGNRGRFRCGPQDALPDYRWSRGESPATQLRKAMLEELQRRNLSQISTRIYLAASRSSRAISESRPASSDRNRFVQRVWRLQAADTPSRGSFTGSTWNGASRAPRVRCIGSGS